MALAGVYVAVMFRPGHAETLTESAKASVVTWP